MSEDFVSSFIEECVDKNIFGAQDICQEALKQIKDHEEELLRADKIRIRIYNLRKVLKQFNHDSVRKIRSNRIADTSLNVKGEDDVVKHFATLICDYIETHGPSSPHEIRDSIGSYESHSKIYGAIKWLGESGVIVRDSSGLKLLKGKNWDSRLSNEV